jgi:Ca-activated chloride channel family protein
MEPRHRRLGLLLCGSLLALATATADDKVLFHGKVTLQDGSPPGKLVLIQRTCEGADQSIPEGAASAKTGEYLVSLRMNELGQIQSSLDMYATLPCVLEAELKGYVSSKIDLSNRLTMLNPRLPVIVLTPKSQTTTAFSTPSNVPHSAQKDWSLAIKQLTERNWTAAEAPLKAVVQAAPKFPSGWAALGTLYGNLGKAEEARTALLKAVELDPKPLTNYLSLARAQVDVKDFKGAVDTSQILIQRDTKHTYVEAYYLGAIALYQLHDFDKAQAQIDDAIRMDKLRELPRAEYVLGLILEAKKDYPGAEQHLKSFVLLHPRAKEVAKVNERLANLGKEPLVDLAGELTPLDMRAAAAGEAPVPGGIKAFSAVAQLKSGVTPAEFFLEYAHAISDPGSTGSSPTREAGEEIKSFVAAVQALETLGEPEADGTLIRIALTNPTQIHRSQSIVAELGLKLVQDGDSFSLQPGERPHDGIRQWVLAGLGVDEYELRKAVHDKQEFSFQIPKENARLMGGPAWGLMLKGVPDMAGGPSEAFIKDWRFARVYSGLGAMDNDAASAVVAAVSLTNLIVKYSNVMASYGEAIAMENQHVAVPGGAKAQASWTKLAGVSPQNPGPFLRALIDKDDGRLLAFYHDLMHADAAHQQFFTENSIRADAFYRWFRDSTVPGMMRNPDRWQTKILQKIRIDATGKVIFPGGRESWATKSQSDDEILLHDASLEALAAVAELEDKRGAPFSVPAAQIMAQRYKQWRHLFPYFEKLPALDTPAFQALAGFADDTAKLPTPRRNLLMGEWNSLVKLIVMGVQAGSVNNGQAAQAFQQACEAMRSANPSKDAIATLRSLAGGSGELENAVAGQLLRLSAARREAFDHLKKIQGIPTLSAVADASDANATLAALSGTVYAAVLDPAFLLVAEDPQLASKHNFVPPGDLFAPSILAVSSDIPGTNFSGGFAKFQDVSHLLNRQTEGELMPELDASVTPSAPGAPAPASGPAVAPEGDLVFRAGGRIVEVYATVTDSRGHYVDELQANQFSIMEQGQAKPVFAFENHTAAVSVALLFDTTGSMVDALPPLKDAAMQLVENLRATDSVAIYSFSDSVNELQSFTSDKELAKRAILKTHAEGITALYDALVRVNHDLAARGGKKVIIVFTDGSDNSSMLMSNTAIERAKSRGIPIYTIAEGEALLRPQLMAELAKMSQSTGGSQFVIRKLSDIGTVFEKVSQDLLHGYLVAFQPSPGDDHAWRKIDVVLSGSKGLVVRAREGFYVE